jgi:hypothetical protein
VEGHGFQVKADKNVNNVDIDLMFTPLSAISQLHLTNQN